MHIARQQKRDQTGETLINERTADVVKEVISSDVFDLLDKTEKKVMQL